jgi:hypothetical protein
VRIVDPNIPFRFKGVDINIVGKFRTIIPFNPIPGCLVKPIIGLSSGRVLILEILRVGIMDLSSAVVRVIVLFGVAPGCVISVRIVDPGFGLRVIGLNVNVVGEVTTIVPFNPGPGCFVKPIIRLSFGRSLIREIFGIFIM